MLCCVSSILSGRSFRISYGCGTFTRKSKRLPVFLDRFLDLFLDLFLERLDLLLSEMRVFLFLLRCHMNITEDMMMKDAVADKAITKTRLGESSDVLGGDVGGSDEIFTIFSTTRTIRSTTPND